MKRRQRGLLIAGGVVVVIAIAIVAFGGSVLRAGISAAGHAAGYGISYQRLENHGGRLTLTRPDIAGTHGEPFFSARRIVIAYNLRDFFRKPYFYGIHGVEIDRPKLTIVHHKDGSYNFTFPKRNGASKLPTIPKIRLLVKDGSIGVVDETRIFAHSRRLAFENIQLDADIDPRKRSSVVGGLTVLEEGGKFPFSLAGTVDVARGYADIHIAAPTLALAPLFDYAVNSRSLHVAYGMLNDVNAHIYALRDKSGAMRPHLSITANLDHFQPYLNGIAKPLRDGRGYLQVYDDGLAITKADGSIAGVPLRIAGAIYGLGHPMFHLGIAGRGDLERLITLSDAAKHFPLEGPVAFKIFVEGSATQPLTFVRFNSPGISYRNIPLDDPHGLVALHGSRTSIIEAGLRYDGIAVGTRGTVVLGKHTAVDLLARAAAPVSRLPYGADILGPMTVDGTVVAAGTDAKLATSGVFAGATATQQLVGTLAVDGQGEGTVGPITLAGPGNRRLYARVALDRPHAGGGAAFVALHDFTLSTSGVQPSLPGFALPQAPPLSGTLDGALAGAFAGKRFVLGGDAHASGVVALGYPIDDLTFHGNVRDGARVQAQLRYRGSLEALARAAGGKLKARGQVDLPIAVVAAGRSSAIAQIAGARFDGASVNGIPLEALDGTLGIAGKTLDVYAARLRLGGQDVVAQGSFGGGGTLDVSAANIDLAALRAWGLPVAAGTVSAIARVGGTPTAPLVDAGVAASDVRSTNPRIAKLPLDAGTTLRFAGDTLTISDGNVVAGPAIGTLDGTVSGVRGTPQDARYDLQAAISEADIGTFAQLFHAPHYPEGTLDATARVTGQGRSPSVAGRITIPEGSLNGLAYRDATVALSGNANVVRARGGTVTVGSSVIGFNGDVSRRTQRLALRAPHLELTDFNDYFNYGDTLGGHGALALALQNAPDHLALDGRLRLRGTRFRRFELGDARADLATSGRTIFTNLVLGSTAGRISEAGDVTLAAHRPLHNALSRTSLALNARAQNVDLGVWLPAAGIAAPLVGKIDADARIAGTYPDIRANAHAALQDGLVKRIPIRTATLDARAAGRRFTITRAVLAIDDLQASAAGSVGLRPQAPLDLTVLAQTQDIGALAHTFTGKTYDAAGALRTTLHVSGTPRLPLLEDTFDAEGARYARYTLPHAHADVAITRSRVSVKNAAVDLNGGRVVASGDVPLSAGRRPGIAPTAPLAFRLSAQKVDLAQFAALFPKGTRATGTLDGGVVLGGSVANPGLSGTIALSNGSFVGPQVRSKLTDAVAQLTFAGTTATLHDTSGKVGGGTIVAMGQAAVPSLRRPAHDLAGRLHVALNSPVLDVPAFFRGRLDGALDIVRSPDAPIDLGGNVAFSSTRIPLSAVFNPKAPQTPAAPALPLALDLNVAVDRDVRVQGGPVDIGATGNLHVGGSLAGPQLAGELTTVGGGTFSFYRTFRVQDGSTISFDPSNGVIPTVDISATTTVSNPSTDVSLEVTGLATQLNVALASTPAYSREQILGLLVGAQTLGAVSGIQQTAATGPQQNPFEAAAVGQLGSLLTQNIFEPFSSQVGGALGLSNFAFNYLPGSGGVSLNAARRLFANVNVVFAESFNYPQRQSVGLQFANKANTTAAQLTFFSQPGVNKFAPIQTNALFSTNQTVTAAEPSSGGQGVSFSLQRKF
ncbi:MAG: translocation/assembly module TamB domain-containing protein [Candidatus Eremiobacteraeota bacterium]|nr:translocation/assembly module TamB domain-containing protein [Candidatus Eremiobacteraeota bacterium]